MRGLKLDCMLVFCLVEGVCDGVIGDTVWDDFNIGGIFDEDTIHAVG